MRDHIILMKPPGYKRFVPMGSEGLTKNHTDADKYTKEQAIEKIEQLRSKMPSVQFKTWKAKNGSTKKTICKSEQTKESIKPRHILRRSGVFGFDRKQSATRGVCAGERARDCHGYSEGDYQVTG